MFCPFKKKSRHIVTRLMVACVVLETLDVYSLQALFALLDCELDLLAFVEALVALAQNAAVMHEHVIRVCALDKAIALCVAEPLDGSSFSVAHCLVSLSFQGLECFVEARRQADCRTTKIRPNAKAQADAVKHKLGLASLPNTIPRLSEPVKLGCTAFGGCRKAA
jgi:hypothetical protein